MALITSRNGWQATTSPPLRSPEEAPAAGPGGTDSAAGAEAAAPDGRRRFEFVFSEEVITAT